MKRKLRKAILGILGTATLAGVSTQAGAFSSTSMGTFSGTTLSVDGAAPFRSWSDYGTNVNFGWVHTADWLRVQVGSASDITSGSTYDVQFQLSPRGSTGPMTAGGFSIWTSGTAPLIDGSGFHEYNQVRGPSDGGITTNNNLGTAGGGNIVNGRNGWVGYAQNGLSFTNGDGDAVANGGGWNGSSPYLTNPGSSYASAGTSATLSLFGLKSGYYLIGLGGVCPDNHPSCNSTSPASRDYTFSVSTAAPIPVPAAVWLFGSALAGMGVIGRRKHKAA
jgi:hypothetical protein